MAVLGREFKFSDEKNITEIEKSNNTLNPVTEMSEQLIQFTQKLNEVTRNIKDLYTCAEKLVIQGKEIKKQLTGN